MSIFFGGFKFRHTQHTRARYYKCSGLVFVCVGCIYHSKSTHLPFKIKINSVDVQVRPAVLKNVAAKGERRCQRRASRPKVNVAANGARRGLENVAAMANVAASGERRGLTSVAASGDRRGLTNVAAKGDRRCNGERRCQR